MSISWPLERSKDAKAQANLGTRFLSRLWIAEWLVLLSVSIVLALAASLISVITAWLSTLREGHCRAGWYVTRQACSDWADWPHGVQWLVYFALSVLLATLAGVIALFAPRSEMSGIPALRSYFQGFDIPQLMSIKTAVSKLAGIGLVSASGLWLGQEAPLVHVSAAATAALARHLPISEARVRDLSLAAAAVGISVAFSAPLGGVIFGLEVFIPSREVAWRMFVSSIVAIVVLQSIVAPSSALGGMVVPETGLFRVSYDRVWHAVEILPFGVLGVLGGLFGSAVSRLANLPTKLYTRFPVVSAAAAALVTAMLGYATIASRMPMTQLLADLFAECKSEDAEQMFCQDKHIGALVYTLVLACTLFPLSITLEVPSGILFPSLVAGAILGRLVGLGMQGLLERLPLVLSTSFCPDKSQHCITPGVYALVGAGSVLTGISRLTVASVVLMFETTGALSFIVPIMIGVITSKWVVDTLGASSGVLETWNAREKFPLLPDSTATIPDLYASEIMVGVASVEAIRVPEGAAFTPPPTKFVHKSVPVLSTNDEYLDLYSPRSQQSEPTIVLSPAASLRLIVSAMKDLGVRTVVLCADGKFAGLVCRRDVISVLENPHPVVTAADVAEFEVEDEL